MYARGINRIRHLYLEYAPQMQPYFILSSRDDRGEILGHEAMNTSWLQVFFSTADMIAVINSVLVGSFVGLLLAVFTFPLILALIDSLNWPLAPMHIAISLGKI